MRQGKFNVLGVMIDAVDYATATSQIVEAARGRRGFAVSALAVHGLMTGVLDKIHRHRLNRFDLLAPDGQPVRWALNGLHRAGLAERVYGPNLTLEVCRAAADASLPIYLFGGSRELLDRLQANLRARFPNLRIAGARESRFRRLSVEEKHELIREIKESGAAMTFVGLGCPRQEVFAYELRDALGMPLLAVGAAFNFHAGMLSQAPGFMQRRGLEWLYRLWIEPRRLWKRYLLLNPLYLTLLFLQWTRLRTIDPHTTVEPQGELLYG